MRRNLSTGLFTGATLAALALLASTLASVGQSQPAPGQQPDSFVAAVAAADALPFVPTQERTSGTYWDVCNSLPCLGMPLPCPPDDGSSVYAIGGTGQFLVDRTGGQLQLPLPTIYRNRTLGATDYAEILQAQVDEVQAFIGQVEAGPLGVQAAGNGVMSAANSYQPPLPPGGGNGTNGSSGGGGIVMGGRTPTTNDLWLELKSVYQTTGTANLIIHQPWNIAKGVYELLYCTNLTPPILWQWILRTAPGQTNLTVYNATDPQGFYRLEVPTDSTGTNFWLAFPYLYPYWSVNLSLYVSSSRAAAGTVTIPGFGVTNAFSVAAGTVTNIQIDPSVMMADYDMVETYGVHLTASQPVSVVAMKYDFWTSAAFNCLPLTFAGTNYCVLARPSAIDSGGCYSQFAIVATADNTTVSITPSATANLDGHPGSYHTKLMQAQTYQIGTSNADYTSDVTGTWIVSDKPIVVLAGASIAHVTEPDIGDGNPLVQEQLPVDTWGEQVLALSFARNTGGDSYRVLAATDKTVVFTNGVVAGTNQAGQFLDLNLDGPVEFRANRPIQVAQFAKGGSLDAQAGDPCEILLPPIGRYLQTNIVFTLPPGNVNTVGDFTNNYVAAIVPASALSNTLVDGSTIPLANFIPIGTSGYYGAQVPVTNAAAAPTAHTVTSSQPVGVQVYGIGWWDAYGYFGGIAK